VAGRVILGIDPGLVKTGWGVIRIIGHDLTYVDCGVLRSSANASLGDRLVSIFTGIQRLIHHYQPIIAAIEEVFLNSNPKSTERLVMARTAAYLALAISGLRISEFKPNEIKKSVTGNGHAEKRLVSSMVWKILRLDQANKEDFAVTFPTDATDALAIAICLGFFSSTVP
jgi:crossover junction endodeoxyribonuclease RuvC